MIDDDIMPMCDLCTMVIRPPAVAYRTTPRRWTICEECHSEVCNAERPMRRDDVQSCRPKEKP